MTGEFLSELRYRLRAIVHKNAMDRELDDEMRDHLERETARLVSEGMPAEEARRQARIAFGAVDNHKESTREARGTAWLDQLNQDTRYAARTLRRNPVFTAAAVLSLGLGIGANTAMFSALDALMLRPLPVEKPNELVTFEVMFNDGFRQYNLGYPDYQRIGALRGVVQAATATSWAESFDVRQAPSGPPIGTASAHVSVVTGNYFSMLGLRASHGRLFSSEDDGDDMGGHAVVVLSDTYWDRQFGRSPDVLGKPLVVNGTTFTVVGVAPRGFAGDWVGWPTDFWVPSSMISSMHPEAEGRPRNRYQFKVLARLEPNVSLQKAQAAADLLYARILEEKPAGSGITANARLVVTSAATGYSPQRESFGRPLTILMAIVGAVLLIACANMANLQMARAVARRREIALRIALGASRGRVMRQLMTESVLLAMLGGVLGLYLAMLGMNLLAALASAGPSAGVATSANPSSVQIDLRINGRVLLFASILSGATSILFGMLPAFRGSVVALLPALGVGGRRSSDSGRAFTRGALVISQVALSVVLVAGTGLFVRTLNNLQTQELGVDRRGLLLVSALPGHTGRTPDQIAELWQTTQDRIASLPGVRSAAISVDGLVAGSLGGGPLVLPAGGAAGDSTRIESTMTVSPGFFATVGQRMRSGRDFTRLDTDSSRQVVIANESAARRLFGDVDRALGRQIVLRGVNTPYAIVGIVADAKRTPRAPTGPALYYPPGQNIRRLSRGMAILVRAEGDARTLAQPLREVLRRIDPRLPVLSIDTADDQLDRLLFKERLVTTLSVSFAALAIVLSGVGLYGLISYVTARRTQEIGIRVALGAPQWGLVWSVIRDSLRLAVIGIVLGVIAALWATRSITALLYGVGARDPWTIAGASLVIVFVALAAGLIPALRAARLNPVNALRVD